MEDRLKKLRALTKMALDVEMMKLQKIQFFEAEKADQIEELHQLESERATELSEKGGADLALYSGADNRWSIWKQKKVAGLNTQKAALIAAKDEQRQHTQKAFGKDKAVGKLAEIAREATRITQSRM